MRGHWTNLLTGCTACAIVAATCNLPAAQGTGTTAAQSRRLSFELMDRNADQRISAEEFRNSMATVFESQDRNLDGVVARAEVELSGPRAVAAFEEAGGRANGRLMLPEFLDFTMQVFDGVDTNSDGFVTPDEARAAVAKVKAAQAK